MWFLPENERVHFKEPFGALFPDIDKALEYLGSAPVYAVGDVVTRNLIRRGIVPQLSVIDGNTMREPCKCTPLLPVKRIEVKNPAWFITEELICALRTGVESPPALVHVDGEEDLAVIPLVMMLSFGGAVLYGQPCEGVVVRIVDSESKKRAEELFSLFVKV
ncbi:MAG: GTP-dependent dephospho-CoA kinase family protein [Candidatus Methanomethylophilaceae archaeon]|nr:GTP-dependent dephospho-CoA kinase family protein [Candidatus Methanomethylophilaceae archaeon]